MAPISNTAEIAGYAYVIPLEANQTVDEAHVTSDEEGHVVMVNGTLIRLMLNKPFRDSQLNELLYVIIVIVFYATALMTLIITQIKRQRREGSDVDYYDEYLQRNQEVKRTCQTATTLVRKSEKPGSSYTAATAPSSEREASGHLLELPSRAREQSPRSSRRQGTMSSLAAGLGGGVGVVGRGVGVGGGVEEEGGSLLPLGTSPRDSPMLESIPDIGT